jgi:hypothetical protein
MSRVAALRAARLTGPLEANAAVDDGRSKGPVKLFLGCNHP